MEEQLAALMMNNSSSSNNNSSAAGHHLLQLTLRSFCTSSNSPWVYAVFWRILPRNHPPPTSELGGRAYGTTARNGMNWILAWEDGFCNFSCSSQDTKMLLQPQAFFKMSHEIHSCSLGLMGKVAVAESHRWVSRDDLNHNVLPKSTFSSDDFQPRSWEAQFQSGIKTIALIAVTHGLLQLGSFNDVMESSSFVEGVRHKFGSLGNIPGGFLLPYPPPPPPSRATAAEVMEWVHMHASDAYTYT